ncbi:MAG: transcriptional regulator NrdR [Atopostipes suicloacalis]|nr:transcriptional regulator NrdR [Atopostipes suicloacalis]
MKCPRCFYIGSRVIDSRPSDDGLNIRRRRECESCQYRFNTFERIEERPLLVVKKNKDREEFDRSKILRGLHRAFEKRPFSAKDQEAIVQRIEGRIREEGQREIDAEQIGEYVMEELIQLDDVAYIRFASVYRQFHDINVFMEEMQNIEGRRGSQKKDESQDTEE